MNKEKEKKKNETEPIFIHEIKLEGENQFVKNFNAVSDLYDKAVKEDTKKAWDDFMSAKYCLEMGIIPFENV